MPLFLQLYFIFLFFHCKWESKVIRLTQLKFSGLFKKKDPSFSSFIDMITYIYRFCITNCLILTIDKYSFQFFSPFEFSLFIRTVVCFGKNGGLSGIIHI